MEVIINGAARTAAFVRARAAYNASNATLTEQEYLQKLVDGQLDALVSAYVTTKLSKLAFLQRFTAEERVAIRAAAQASPAVEDYLEMLKVSEEVEITHDLTVAGVQALEEAGLIGQGRSAQILAL